MNTSREYIFESSAQEFASALQQVENPIVESLGNGKYRLWAEVAVGVKGKGVSVFLSVRVESVRLQRLKIRTKTRNEHYILLGIFALFFVMSIASSVPAWTPLLVLGMWIASHSLFQVIVRSQEFSIISRFTGQLELKETGLRIRE